MANLVPSKKLASFRSSLSTPTSTCLRRQGSPFRPRQGHSGWNSRVTCHSAHYPPRLNAGLVFPEKCRCSGVRLSSRKPLSSHSLLETDAVQPPFLRSPRCCAFFRFHNGTLLDRRQQGSGPHLELQGLLMEQAGEYHCKAWNDAGTVRSRAAHLTILGECGPVPPHPSPAQAPSPSASLP